MANLLVIIAGIAAVLAVIVTALIVGVCLLINWVTGAGRTRDDEEYGPRNVRRPQMPQMPQMPRMTGGHRRAPSRPTSSRRGW